MRPTLLAAALLALPASAQLVTEPGFETLSSLPAPSVFGAHATLADGRLFDFDGQDFRLYDPAGNLLTVLGTLPAPVFASFAVPTPDGLAVLVGESANGDLLRVPLDGSPFTVVGNLNFNFDAAFDPTDGDVVWVSAALGGFGQGNDLVRLDLAAGSSTQVAHVAGPSGPLVVDAEGDLYYVTQSDVFPTVPGSLDLLAWSREQLESGLLLDEGDARLVRDGLDGGADLALDPTSGNLFLTETSASGIARVLELDRVSGELLDVVATSGSSTSKLELRTVGGIGTFHAYQPAGVELVVRDTDFVSFTAQLLRIAPRRPLAALDGAQAGAAVKTLTVSGAEPDSAVLVTWGSVADQLASETSTDLGWGAPFHSIVPPGLVRRQPFLVPTDGAGDASWSYFDPGNLHGTLVFQCVLRGEDGGFVGSSTFVNN